MGAVKARALILVFMAALMSVVIEANIAEFDEVWKTRAAKAEVATTNAYKPAPEKVVHHLNNNVHASTGNSTRRGLGNTDACVATNPIDQCWRCHDNWEGYRMRLSDCGLGFGGKATGGRGGQIYVVTDPSDDELLNPKRGTLRYGVIQPGPLWIVFQPGHMVIRLKEELIFTSDKTIDGRGADVHIQDGAGFMLQFVQNIIIHNINIHNVIPGKGGLIRDSVTHFGLRTKSDGDGISIFGSANIWIDHVSMWKCFDGLIDAVQGSTAITISNSYFTDHDHVMLFGANDLYAADKKMQVTVAFNRFDKGLTQRLPRVRWGFAHVVNNDYTEWGLYAIGGSASPTIISQGNRFAASNAPFTKEVTKRDAATPEVWKNWLWKSEGDLMLNGAFFVPSGNPTQTIANDLIAPKPGSCVGELTRFVGWLNCKVGSAC